MSKEKQVGQSKNSQSSDWLWVTIQAEVAVLSQQEPILTSFFYDAVLSHQSLEEALSYNLAVQIDNTVLSALTIREVFIETMVAEPAIGDSMRKDLTAYVERDPACDQYCLPLLYFKGFHALQIYRVANWLWRNGRQSLALYLQNRVSEIFAVDIHPAAQIGSGIMIDHATGVVIGETAIVGNNVSILHSVTLGGSGCTSGSRHPTIGNGVLISAGAKILGNISVGDGVKVGAGSLVLESVPAHVTVAGVPARIIGTPVEDQPALEMDQHLSGS